MTSLKKLNNNKFFLPPKNYNEVFVEYILHIKV